MSAGGGAMRQVGLGDEGHGHGDVFITVDGEVDLFGKKGLLEFLDEEAFSAGVGEGDVGQLVAGGFDDDGFDFEMGVKGLEIGDDERGFGRGRGGCRGFRAGV